MRERARDKGRLQDIIEYADNVTMLIKGFDLEMLVTDKRTYYSVVKNIEVVGEAAYMLTKAFKRTHTEVPWKVIQGMRHFLVHDYATIDDKELYNTPSTTFPYCASRWRSISLRPTGKHGSPPPTILTPMRIWQKSPAA